MAKILYAVTIAEARGKEGGTVFSRNSYGPYIRAKTSPVQPRTPEQMSIRAAFTGISQAWRDTLTPAQRAAWDDYAKQTSMADVFGKKINLTGAVMFLRYNTVMVIVLASPLLTAPTLPGQAAMPSITLTGTVAAGVNIASITPFVAVGDNVAVYSNKAPIPQSREFFNGPWTRRPFMNNATVFPFLCVPIAEVALGQRWWVKTRLYKADGKVGPVGIARVDIVA